MLQDAVVTFYSADQMREQNIQKLGADLGTEYSALWQHIANVHIKWSEYKELYGTSPTRIDLLNRAAPNFFGKIQKTLWNEVLLLICQLTDPPKIGKRKNLTILRLPELIKESALGSAVEAKVKEAESNSTFCRDWRNRHIAHLDRDLALESNAEPLMEANRAMVKQALESIAAPLKLVAERFFGSDLRFDIYKPIHGAVSLLHVIDDGLKAGLEREDRLSQGNWLPSDTRRKI